MYVLTQKSVQDILKENKNNMLSIISLKLLVPNLCVYILEKCVQKHFKNLEVEQTNTIVIGFIEFKGSWELHFFLYFVIWICL